MRARGLLPSWHRVAVVGVLVFLLMTVFAAPALGHSRAEIATNFDSRITATPDLVRVRWSVLGGGDLVQVQAAGDHEVTVLGYEGEPYLRIGPDGVFENRHSPATYLNQERYADVAVPPRADAAAEPEWAQISDTPRHAWHDHRVHWMSEAPPPVAEGATEAVLVQEWSVPMVVDGTEHSVEGELWWVPPSVPWGWLVAAALLTAPALAGLRFREASGQSLVRPAAAIVTLVALANGFLVVDELTWPAPLLDQLFGVFHQLLFIGAGVAGAALAWSGRGGPYLALGIASGAVLFHQGLLPIRMLWAAELPTVWPAGLLRGLVAMSLVQAVWVAVVITRGLRSRPAHTTEAVDDERVPTATA